MQRVEFRDRLDLKGLWREEVKKMRFGGSVWALWCGFVWSALAGFHIFTHTLSPKASVHAEPLIKTLKSLVHRWEKTLEKGYKAVGFVEVVCHEDSCVVVSELQGLSVFCTLHHHILASPCLFRNKYFCFSHFSQKKTELVLCEAACSDTLEDQKCTAE